MAVEPDDAIRGGAWVAEPDGDVLKGWPQGMRHIVRKERPHPGAQLRFTDADGLRPTAFATNTTNTTNAPVAAPELRHRQRARAEDRIRAARAARAAGLRNLPLHGTAQNQIWLEIVQIVQIALDLLAWMPMLALTGETRRWEPRRRRLRLFSAAAQIVTTARRRHLRSAKGPTHGEISAHLAEVYGAEVSRQTISTIIGQVMDGMAEWQNRPLDRVRPVLFVDAVSVEIRDGKVATRPVHVVMAVTVEGTRDILGIWVGDGGEGAKYRLRVFTELKNRGLDDVLMPVCDGPGSLPDAVETVWPRTLVQTCIVHLLRISFRCASRADWDKIAKDLKPVHTAPNESAAAERFSEFPDAWGKKYPAIIRLWENAWAEFVRFLSFDIEIRTVTCSTNPNERSPSWALRKIRTSTELDQALARPLRR